MPFIYGHVFVLPGTSFCSPLSLGVAVYHHRDVPQRPRAKNHRPSLVELLAAIPSVIYGLWGSSYWRPCCVSTLSRSGQDARLTGFFSGPDVRAGDAGPGKAIIMAIMVVPIIASIARGTPGVSLRTSREAVLGGGCDSLLK